MKITIKAKNKDEARGFACAIDWVNDPCISLLEIVENNDGTVDLIYEDSDYNEPDKEMTIKGF